MLCKGVIILASSLCYVRTLFSSLKIKVLKIFRILIQICELMKPLERGHLDSIRRLLDLSMV